MLLLLGSFLVVFLATILSLLSRCVAGDCCSVLGSLGFGGEIVLGFQIILMLLGFGLFAEIPNSSFVVSLSETEVLLLSLFSARSNSPFFEFAEIGSPSLINNSELSSVWCLWVSLFRLV